MPFASIEDAAADIRDGRMIIIVDDEDRENEGDLTLAAEKVTPEAINFMARYGRGLVCLAMTEERLEHLRVHGPTTFAFTFRQRFSAPDGQRAPELDDTLLGCPA